VPAPNLWQKDMTEPNLTDHEYLTVKELAQLLRLKERKIYDLAASGQVPCSKATGKLLFPARDIRAWINRARTETPNSDTQADMPRPSIFLGSHDPLLDWAIRQSRCGLASFYDGSMDGLERFARFGGVAAGLHVLDAATGAWNTTAVAQRVAQQNVALIGFAARQRGIVYRAGVKAPSSLADLAGLRFVPRQTGSGADRLFWNLAKEQGLNMAALDLAEVTRTEDEAVDAVRRGDADAAFGLAAVADTFGLHFLPVITEEYAILVDRKAWFEPAMQGLFAFCQSAAFAKRAAAMPGYDIAPLGRVLWNA
jgi:putative molybdopterin biosynthesis protein